MVHKLVEDELHTLPGIGPRLASAVKTQVFHGELSDLRNASLVDGIGPQKQAAISNWLSNVERRLPGLMAAESPTRQEITRRYHAERDRLTLEIAAAEGSRFEQAALLVLVNDEVYRLSTVNASDFVTVMGSPAGDAEKVNRYLLGVFAPWEPMPEWFSQALEAAQSDHTT